MKIRSDLPIKYYLGLHNIEKLTDEFSILFDIIQYIIKVAQIKQRPLSPESFKFTSKSLKYIFGEKMEDETFKTKVVKEIKLLASQGYLRAENGTIYINQNALDRFYTK
jgi:hypothetical protein